MFRPAKMVDSIVKTEFLLGRVYAVHYAESHPLNPAGLSYFKVRVMAPIHSIGHSHIIREDEIISVDRKAMQDFQEEDREEWSQEKRKMHPLPTLDKARPSGLRVVSSSEMYAAWADHNRVC